MQFWKTEPAEEPVYPPSVQTSSPGPVDDSVLPQGVEHGDPGATISATATGARAAIETASRGSRFRILGFSVMSNSKLEPKSKSQIPSSGDLTGRLGRKVVDSGDRGCCPVVELRDPYRGEDCRDVIPRAS